MGKTEAKDIVTYGFCLTRNLRSNGFGTLSVHFGHPSENPSILSVLGEAYAFLEHERRVLRKAMANSNPISVTVPSRLEKNSPGSVEPFSIEERMYSAREVAARLGVSERWLRDHATRRSPRIRAFKLGPLVRFRWSDVQAFVAELTAKNDSKCR